MSPFVFLRQGFITIEPTDRPRCLASAKRYALSHVVTSIENMIPGFNPGGNGGRPISPLAAASFARVR